MQQSLQEHKRRLPTWLTLVLRGGMPVYELFCLARPQLAKEQLASLIKTACTSVFTNNGVLTEVQSYDLRDLAYPIRKAGSKYEQVCAVQCLLKCDSCLSWCMAALTSDVNLICRL